MIMDPVVINYGTLFQAAVNEVMNAITQTVPAITPVLAVMTSIGIGLKLYRRFAGTR